MRHFHAPLTAIPLVLAFSAAALGQAAPAEIDLRDWPIPDIETLATTISAAPCAMATGLRPKPMP